MARNQRAATFRSQYSDDFEPTSRPGSSVRFSEEILTYEDTYSSSQSSSYTPDFDSENSKSKFSYVETIATESKEDDSTHTDAYTYEIPTEKSDRKFSETVSVPEDISFEEEPSSVWSSETRSSETRSYTSVTPSEFSSVTDTDPLDESEVSHSADFTEPSTTRRSPGLSTSEFRTLSYVDSDDSRMTAQLDDNEVKQSFIAKCINNLQLNQLKRKNSQPALPNEVTLNKRSEVDALNSFCCSRIEQLQSNDHHPPLNAPTTREKLTGVYSTDLASDYGITDHSINRILLKNTQDKLQKVADEDVHDVLTCRKCSKKVEKMAAVDFVKRANAIVSEKLINEKVEWNNIWSHDPICLQGEALRDLPYFGGCTSREILDKWRDSILDEKQKNEK